MIDYQWSISDKKGKSDLVSLFWSQYFIPLRLLACLRLTGNIGNQFLGTDYGKNFMDKFTNIISRLLEVLVETISWIAIFISPVLGFGVIAAILYFSNPKNWILAIIITSLGVIIGAIWAENIRRKIGCSNYLGKILGWEFPFVSTPKECHDYIKIQKAKLKPESTPGLAFRTGVI